MVLYIIGVLLLALTFVPDLTDGQVFNHAMGALVLTGLAAVSAFIGLRLSPASRKPAGRILLGLICVAMVVRAIMLPGLRREQDLHNARMKAISLLQAISRTDVDTVGRLAPDKEYVESWDALSSMNRLSTATPLDFANALLLRGWETDEEKRRGREIIILLGGTVPSAGDDIKVHNTSVQTESETPIR